jgi:radical SAM superfamily enzyme YgiQ (UPF0313 family)
VIRELLKPARQRLSVVLIKPSKYDDEGYVIRHFRGVLPSNTLACLYSLTEDLRSRKSLGENLRIETIVLDDSVQKIPVDRIIRSNRPPAHRTVVALVGVQSNQFPRAADLARRFRQGGLQVLIGGFHVTGSLSLSGNVPEEIQELIDLGISIVKGEVEETWGAILQDAVHDRLSPIYDFLDSKPDLYDKPVPRIHRRYFKRFITTNEGTIDCGRGCPFNCSFCTIINVQGRQMRFRSVEMVAKAIRENYHRHGIDFYFFTDDNFSRNALWREIFEMLIGLRAKERIRIRFSCQVDAQSYKIPGFADLANQAGCTQVFIGMESINPKNLKAAGKAQNQVQDYQEMISTWHRAKIATHIAYIIGFPFDTPQSVQEDVERLQWELGAEQASFFMLMPLPGSRDHVRMVSNGEYIDPDLNKYDASHETMRHPNFEPGEWHQAYREAWRNFYTFDYMRKILIQANPENYWEIFLNFIWYRNSALIEGGHPMIHGFFRLKERGDRRPGFPVESRIRHCRRRFRELRSLARDWISLLLEMEELWLQTHPRSAGELRLMAELKRGREEANRSLRSAELQLAHIRAHIHFPELRVPSRLTLMFRDFNLGISRRVTYSRADLQKFWNKTWRNWRQGQILTIRPHRVFLSFYRDCQIFSLFLIELVRAPRRLCNQDSATPEQSPAR